MHIKNPSQRPKVPFNYQINSAMEKSFESLLAAHGLDETHCVASTYPQSLPFGAAPVKCKSAVRCPGERLCEHHWYLGKAPRFPPLPSPTTGRPMEEDMLHQPQELLVRNNLKHETRKPMRRTQCHKALGMDRCENVCISAPFCPVHTVTQLNLLIDLQNIGEELHLGLYAFNPTLGPSVPVFVHTSQVASLFHISAFKDTDAKRIGTTQSKTHIYEFPCGEKSSADDLTEIYGECTRPYCFGFGNESSDKSYFLDTMWYRGIATFANTNTVCNASIVSRSNRIVIECEAQVILQGQSIFVKYADVDVYDFSKLPEIEKFPPGPGSAYKHSTMYDFSGRPLPKSPMVGPSVSIGGLYEITQVKMLYMSAALEYFNSDAITLLKIQSLPALNKMQPWIVTLSHIIGKTFCLHLWQWVDHVFVRDGDLFTRLLRFVHKKTLRTSTVGTTDINRKQSAPSLKRQHNSMEMIQGAPESVNFLRLLSYGLCIHATAGASKQTPEVSKPTPETIYVECEQYVSEIEQRFGAFFRNMYEDHPLPPKKTSVYANAWGHDDELLGNTLLAALLVTSEEDLVDDGTTLEYNHVSRNRFRFSLPYLMLYPKEVNEQMSGRISLLNVLEHRRQILAAPRIPLETHGPAHRDIYYVLCNVLNAAFIYLASHSNLDPSDLRTKFACEFPEMYEKAAALDIAKLLLEL